MLEMVPERLFSSFRMAILMVVTQGLQLQLFVERMWRSSLLASEMGILKSSAIFHPSLEMNMLTSSTALRSLRPSPGELSMKVKCHISLYQSLWLLLHAACTFHTSWAFDLQICRLAVTLHRHQPNVTSCARKCRIVVISMLNVGVEHSLANMTVFATLASMAVD